jgi:DEAD/DEAH box helicase domain-containing protein
MPGDIIVYDIETKDSFQEVGSRDAKKLHISYIGMFSYNENRLIGFTEDEFPLFWRRLESCELLIGYNNHGFDDQVCSVYFPEMSKIASFDILAEIHKNLGFRLKLDNVAQATLGVGKTGDGLHAIELYREGRIEELASYCLDDVKITKDVYEYGKNNGKLLYKDLSGQKEVTVDFHQVVAKPEGALNLSLF